MPQGPRTDRVGEEFREILAEAIQGLKDPRVGFVTVTGVKVSPDLSFEALDELLELAVAENIAGIVATNTTTERPPTANPATQGGGQGAEGGQQDQPAEQAVGHDEQIH